MKIKVFIIAFVAMMFSAVQVHAQRHHHPHHGGHGYYHHPYYRPFFNTWSWYAWNGYTSRYMLYRNIYFDTLLGCYVYGSLDRPSKVQIEGLTFSRKSNGTLKVKNGTLPVTYLDLYRQQTLKYSYADGREIYVTTGNGCAEISFTDKSGNTAYYRL